MPTFEVLWTHPEPAAVDVRIFRSVLECPEDAGPEDPPVETIFETVVGWRWPPDGGPVHWLVGSEPGRHFATATATATGIESERSNEIVLGEPSPEPIACPEPGAALGLVLGVLLLWILARNPPHGAKLGKREPGEPEAEISQERARAGRGRARGRGSVRVWRPPPEKSLRDDSTASNL